jgi:hypothetical protein
VNGVAGFLTKAVLKGPVKLSIREITTHSSKDIFKVIWLVGRMLRLHDKEAGGENLLVIRVKPTEEFHTVILFRDLVSKLKGVSDDEETSVVLHDIVFVVHAGLCSHINKIHQALPGVACGSSSVRV